MSTQKKGPFSPEIIATLGPASRAMETISALGTYTDRFRLNSSHMTVSELQEWLEILNRLHKNKPIRSVTVDLQGAKMRIGQYPQADAVPDKVKIVYDEASTDATVIPVPHERLFTHVLVGEELSLNDDKVHVKIQEKEQQKLIATVTRNGPLSSNKGINRKSHPVPFDDISPKDTSICAVCSHYDFVDIAMSFVYDGSELSRLRDISHQKIVAKIERPESFEHLPNIARLADEIWLCRGDLGAQAGMKQLRDFQIRFEEFAQSHAESADFYLAGQVFEHLTHFPAPTRSEVVHFGNSLHRGYKGIVLSDETAVGVNPVNAVRCIRDLY